VANDGDWYMQFKLCNIYEKGNGVEKNSDSAFKYCKLSSESNYVSALWFLSNYHYYGYGVNKDEKKAFTIMKSLADRGYLPAIGDLGYFYSKGIGTSVNFNEAINYYKIGVSRGDARCQFNLGGQYYNGEGVKKDIKIAIKFLELAANQGFANASNLLQAIKNSQNETSYPQPSSNSRANSEIYTCRYCNSRFTGNGYGYRPDNGTVGIGAEGIGENQIAMFGFCKHGDFCSRKCASEAFINNIRIFFLN
jgi:TPR repeat protein